MKIINLSENEARDYMANEPYIHISIYEPKTEPIVLPENLYRKANLFLTFHDLDKPCGDYKIFSCEQAHTLLKFVYGCCNLEDINLIVVNCGAGLSRSAGVAGALSKIINGDDAKYFKHSLPNMLVYRTILETHNTNFK